METGMARDLAYEDIDSGTQDISKAIQGYQGQGQGTTECNVLFGQFFYFIVI